MHQRAAALILSAMLLTGCAPLPSPAPAATVSPTETVPPPTSSPTPEPTPTPAATTSPESPTLYPVQRVVDGDTLYVTMEDGERRGIRVIGIDTPETVSPSVPDECYGAEASAAAHARLDGQSVALTRDPTQAEVDYYGRHLYYVALEDGTDFGLSMIQDGLAEEYTYRKKPHQRAAEYAAAEELARETGEGQWGNC